MNEKKAIDEFYNGRTVFITGASGFMGKVLLEKLLYGCPSLKRIYILLRPKKSNSITSRLDAMFRLPLFDRIRSTDPKLFQKVIAINGDVNLPDLGMNVKDKNKLTSEVSVVFHCAASLKLEGKLKDLINSNLTGTKRVIQLCYEMPQLKVLLHLSTAFCHVDITEMEEKIYSCDVDPEDIIRMTEWLDEDTIEIITPRLLGPHPNCYTYTKRLSETLIDQQFPKLPVAVVRPCIVTPSWKEPVPGWVDSLNGPMGLLVGGGKGVIRTMQCRGDYIAEVIPVDYAINAIIGFSWTVGTSNNIKRTPVLNITESKSVPITWKKVLDLGKEACRENPFEMILWYPDGNIHSSYIAHILCVIFFHWLPALLIDMLMLVLRQKTFMIRIQRKITEGLTVLIYFTTKQWIFHSDALKLLKTTMSDHDKQMFPLNTDDFDIKQYLTNCVLGARHFMMKEDPKTLPRQRILIKVYYILDKLAKLFFYIFLTYYLINLSDSLRNLFSKTKYDLALTPLWSSSSSSSSVSFTQ